MLHKLKKYTLLKGTHHVQEGGFHIDKKNICCVSNRIKKYLIIILIIAFYQINKVNFG